MLFYIYFSWFAAIQLESTYDIPNVSFTFSKLKLLEMFLYKHICFEINVLRHHGARVHSISFNLEGETPFCAGSGCGFIYLTSYNNYLTCSLYSLVQIENPFSLHTPNSGERKKNRFEQMEKNKKITTLTIVERKYRFRRSVKKNFDFEH